MNRPARRLGKSPTFAMLLATHGLYSVGDPSGKRNTASSNSFLVCPILLVVLKGPRVPRTNDINSHQMKLFGVTLTSMGVFRIIIIKNINPEFGGFSELGIAKFGMFFAHREIRRGATCN